MPNKKSSSKEKKREYRIYQEIIVDCYDEIEQMLGWQCYLKDTLEFPFVAKCIKKRNTSPLDIGETVTVIDIDTSEDYEKNIFVNVKLTRTQDCGAVCTAGACQILRKNQTSY